MRRVRQLRRGAKVAVKIRGTSQKRNLKTAKQHPCCSRARAPKHWSCSKSSIPGILLSMGQLHEWLWSHSVLITRKAESKLDQLVGHCLLNESFLCRRNTCWSFSNSRTRLGENCAQEWSSQKTCWSWETKKPNWFGWSGTRRLRKSRWRLICSKSLNETSWKLR